MPASARKIMKKSLPGPAASSQKVVRGSIAVIGLGNWGTALAHAVAKTRPEAKIVLREVVVRRKRKGRSRLPIKTWDEAALDAEILWLCVPDDAIESACAELVRRRASLRGQIAVHASGARESALLTAAQKSGARIASVHPVMSFPRREAVPLAGVLYGVETADDACRRRLFKVLRALGGEPFPIVPGSKHLYHAAGTLASPLMVSAFTAAVETARLAGLGPAAAAKMAGVLATATLANVRARGAARSFSGPFARGDAGTIKLHLQALAEHPLLTGVYRALAAQALDPLSSLPVRGREAIAALLQEPRSAAAQKSRWRRPKAGADKL